MANVRLTVGGRNFVVACAPGEEAHVSRLGKMIDEKIADTQDAAALNEPRVLLYAALLLADELHEARQGLAGQTPAPAHGASLQLTEMDAQRLNAIAAKMENLATQLETDAEST